MNTPETKIRILTKQLEEQTEDYDRLLKLIRENSDDYIFICEGSGKSFDNAECPHCQGDVLVMRKKP